MESRIILSLQNDEVRIEPTNLCNYDCIMCPRDKHTRNKGIMSMELYKDVLEQVVMLGAKKITLTNFGEPFIDPTLEEKILLATQYGLYTYVITNASLFHMTSSFDSTKTKLDAAICNGLKEIRLSFYGKNESEYSSIMRGGNYDKVIKNIKLLRNLKTRDLVVSHYILQFDDDIKYEEYPYDLRAVVDYYEIWKPHNFGDGRTYRDITANKTTCGRPQSGPLQINWNGVVVPCCYDYNENIPLGDASTTKIIEILNSTAYNTLRSAHRSGNYSQYKYCDNCDQLLCNKGSTSIVATTHPSHIGLSDDDIVKRTNTSPEVVLSLE